MKKFNTILTIIMLSLLAIMLSACGKSEFGLADDSTEKLMTITAQNASKDSSFVAGSLEVEDGDQIAITSSLTKGKIKLELIEIAEEQTIEKLPDLNGEAALTLELSAKEVITEALPTGSYMLKATCLEKANGTIQIEAKPAK